jgi:hypothetical protein
MRILALQGVLVIGAVQLAVLLAHRPEALLWAAGVAVAVSLVDIRRLLTTGSAGSAAAAALTDEPGESLRRWLSGTEARIRWAESTRADWDRRWRPILARRFEVSAGQRRAKNPAAFNATGVMLFGEELWPWVGPGNVAPDGDRGPGPGRVVLEEILHRLEQR